MNIYLDAKRKAEHERSNRRGWIAVFVSCLMFGAAAIALYGMVWANKVYR